MISTYATQLQAKISILASDPNAHKSPNCMKEEELITTNHVGDVINIIQTTTHHLFDPDELLDVAFDKLGFMSTNISKERKKQEPAVMAELDQRFRRLNSSNLDDNN